MRRLARVNSVRFLRAPPSCASRRGLARLAAYALRPLQLRPRLGLPALGADSVGEARVRARADVALDRHPRSGRIADLLAVAARGQEPLEPLHLPLQPEDALGHPEAGQELLLVE